MGSKFIVPLRLLELNTTPTLPLTSWHKLYYKDGYLKTLKGSEKDVVLDRPLDGFVAGPCVAITATDTVLEAFQKIQCQIDALASLDTFLELTDTPATYAGSSGYAVVVNGAGTGLEFVPPISDTNTWDIDNVAVISTFGDDATGTIGDGNLPFRTVAAAKTAGATNFYFLPGEYTETITLASEETYYAPQGVVFTAGGLRSPATNLDRCKWLGSASFIGNFEVLYLIQQNVITDFVFEFDTIRTTGVASRDIYIWGDVDVESTVTITGNEVYSYGGNGNAIGTLGRVSGTINIKRKLSGFYSLWATYGTGTITLNCPNMVLLDGGPYGNNGAYKQLFVSYGATGYEDITINGNFYSEIASGLASIAGVIVTHVGSAPKKITFNGSAKANQLLYGVRAAVPGGTITINGSMHLPQGRLLSQTGTGSQVAFEDGNSTVYLTSDLGIGVFCFVKNYDILMTADGNHIFSLTDVTSELVTNNVNAEGSGPSPSSYFINTNGNPFQAKLKDTWSTQTNDPAFTNIYASGFTNEPFLKVNPIV